MHEKKYILKLTLLSDTLIGSGEGYGAVIDSDVVFDDIGIPYIPGKRIKGLMLDSAKSCHEMLKVLAPATSDTIVEEIFGQPGKTHGTSITVRDLKIEGYDKNRPWFKFLLTDKKFDSKFTKAMVIDFFTSIRRSTMIDKNTGVAKDHSLRTARVVKRGFVFEGEITVRYEDAADDKQKELVLACACTNLRNIGTKRNRGFGEVECHLIEDGNKVFDKVIMEMEVKQ